jgi:hypothetical protein
MYSTTAYLYQQKTRVLAVDTSGAYFTMRYDPVYAKKLTINKGVDNVILFEFINQDQKPVNISGSSLIFRLISQDGVELMNATQMVIINAQVGRAKVTLTADALNYIQAQPANYSISRTSGNLTEAVFTDAQAGAAAPVDIVDSVLPQFIPSAELTVPDVYGKNQWVGDNPTSWPDWALTPQPQNAIQQTEFYSSYIPTNGTSFTTVKMDLVGYTGTVKLQAAANYESIWYDVTESREYLDETSTIYFNAVGYYPLLRVALNNSIGYGAMASATVVDGVVTSITVTNPGYYYQAAPYVEILGNGAGARAVATIGGNGSVSSIAVIEGGSGYLPIQFGSSISATVLITNGKVQNLQYR